MLTKLDLAECGLICLLVGIAIGIPIGRTTFVRYHNGDLTYPTWVVDEWMEGGFVGEKVAALAHWQCPDGYSVEFPQDDFYKPVCERRR